MKLLPVAIVSAVFWRASAESRISFLSTLERFQPPTELRHADLLDTRRHAGYWENYFIENPLSMDGLEKRRASTLNNDVVDSPKHQDSTVNDHIYEEIEELAPLLPPRNPPTKSEKSKKGIGSWFAIRGSKGKVEKASLSSTKTPKTKLGRRNNSSKLSGFKPLKSRGILKRFASAVKRNVDMEKPKLLWKKFTKKSKEPKNEESKSDSEKKRRNFFFKKSRSSKGKKSAAKVKFLDSTTMTEESTMPEPPHWQVEPKSLEALSLQRESQSPEETKTQSLEETVDIDEDEDGYMRPLPPTPAPRSRGSTRPYIDFLDSLDQDLGLPEPLTPTKLPVS